MNKEMEEFAQKIRDDANKDMKLHIGSLFEEFDGRMLAVKEHHDGQFEKIEKRFDGVEKTLDSHTEMIGELATDISEIKEELKNKVSIS